MTKRLIAFAIVLAMVASFVPVYAIAAEETITQKPGTNARMYNTKADAGVTLTISDCTAKTENGSYTAGKITGNEGSFVYGK